MRASKQGGSWTFVPHTEFSTGICTVCLDGVATANATAWMSQGYCNGIVVSGACGGYAGTGDSCTSWCQSQARYHVWEGNRYDCTFIPHTTFSQGACELSGFVDPCIGK